MARLLFTTWEGGGHVNPLMLVARGLSRRGHQVLVMSDACNALEAGANGLAFRPWTRAPSRTDRNPESDQLKDWEATSPLEQIHQLCDGHLGGMALAYAEDTLEAIETFKPDLVITEEMLFGAMMAAERADRPLVVLTSNVWTFPTVEGLPPFGVGLPPAKTDEDFEFYAKIVHATREGYAYGLPILNAARATLGLAPLADLFDQLDPARLVLLAIGRSFDFDTKLPPHFAHVGPYLADPAWAEPWTYPWPVDNQDPLVLVSFSTFYQRQEDVVRRVIEAMADLQVRGLVTLGPVLEPSDFPSAPHVFVVKSAPHAQILPHTAVSVTHAGHASTIGPLMAGAPVLCMPMGRDQHENAIRAAHRGAGLMLHKDAPPAEIRAALVRLLTEDHFRIAARKLGDAIRGDIEHRDAEDRIEALLASLTTPARSAAG
jgi:MGT family glycosyltransferase